MVITVIALLALIIVVGVMARKNQEKKDKKHMIEHQILQLTKFKGELMSHHTLEDAVIIVTGQYYEQVLNGIKAEIRELKKKINSL